MGLDDVVFDGMNDILREMLTEYFDQTKRNRKHVLDLIANMLRIGDNIAGWSERDYPKAAVIFYRDFLAEMLVNGE